MSAETFAEWLSRIIREDDPANGGMGLLIIDDSTVCAECHGAGSIPAANPEQPQDNGHVLCPECDGEGKTD